MMCFIIALAVTEGLGLMDLFNAFLHYSPYEALNKSIPDLSVHEKQKM